MQAAPKGLILVLLDHPNHPQSFQTLQDSTHWHLLGGGLAEGGADPLGQGAGRGCLGELLLRGGEGSQNAHCQKRAAQCGDS